MGTAVRGSFRPWAAPHCRPYDWPCRRSVGGKAAMFPFQPASLFWVPGGSAFFNRRPPLKSFDTDACFSRNVEERPLAFPGLFFLSFVPFPWFHFASLVFAPLPEYNPPPGTLADPFSLRTNAVKLSTTPSGGIPFDRPLHLNSPPVHGPDDRS